MKYFKILLFSILLTSCGVAVDYDYEKGTNFSDYKTYNYFDDMKTGMNQLDNKRLMRAIDLKLEAMGFSKTENPSFNIDIQTADATNNNNSNVGVGVGSTGRNVGGGISIGIPVGGNRTYREIKIEFVDDSKSGVFWEAVGVISNIGNTPEKREASFVKFTENVFSKYPPKQ